ncbi:MAG TPA: carboxypeptidase-like regulatory domain-containing protein [Anaeromyxobacteraceae bacterium]|nr:carboxypeptidase-like regulatory domain-containing protein [Anaeromyxobacteraceae bacterium]
MPRRSHILPALALALAGCGGLSTPDLTHGNVAGRIVGASPGASVYPLGRPDLEVQAAADGSFELEALPTGAVTLVLFDGGLRAEQTTVAVAGATRTSIVRYGELAPVAEARKMALGALVVVTALPQGGGAPVSVGLSVKQTDRAGTAGPDGAIAFPPLPAGTFELSASQAGYQPTLQAFTVLPGQSLGLDLKLPVDPSEPKVGCAASGGQCRNGLKCDPADGLCYQCVVDDDCTGSSGGGACDQASRFCSVAASATTGTVCSVCTSDAQCDAAGSFGYCEKPGGATATTPGFCTWTAAAPSWPAGFQQKSDGGVVRWVPPKGCATYFEEFGEPCFDDHTCSEADGIGGGFCLGAVQGSGKAGYCTAACTADADCIVPGFACQPDAARGEKVCTRP